MRPSKISLTVDAVVIHKLSTIPKLLLIRRRNDPFKGTWALPGGFVDEDEDLEKAAIRELFEETGMQIENLQQIAAFGKPGRDPRGHTVSIAYFGVATGDTVQAGDDADEAEWFAINDLPDLAFDHGEIISFAINKFL